MSAITYARVRSRYFGVLWYSRVGSHLACPVMEFEAVGKGGFDTDPNTGRLGRYHEEGHFTGPTRFHLEKSHVFCFTGMWNEFTWTRKVPFQVRQFHRAFWGMKPLRQPKSEESQ